MEAAGKLRSVILAVSVAVVCGTAAAATEPIRVTLAAAHPPVLRWVAHLSETFIPAVDGVLDGSAHEITWDRQFGGSLAKVGHVLEATEEGLAEVGLVLSVFEPGKLTIQNASYYTPFSTTDTRIALDAMIALHAEDPAFLEPWRRNGLTYLGGDVGTADYVLMTREPVTTLQDLDGLKIGAAGPGVTWLSGTGAVGVSGNLTTYVTDIKSGVIDGAIVPVNAAPRAGMHDVAPHVLVIGLGAQYGGAIAANADWFAGQPSEVQDALRAGAAAYSDAFAAELAADAREALDRMRAEGAVVTEASPDMRRRWAEGMDNIARTWAAELKGIDGEKVLARYMDAIRSAGETPLRQWDRD